jgi:hypothetical protein
MAEQLGISLVERQRCAGWALEPVWMQWWREKFRDSKLPVIYPVAQRYTTELSRLLVSESHEQKFYKRWTEIIQPLKGNKKKYEKVASYKIVILSSCSETHRTGTIRR